MELRTGAVLFAGASLAVAMTAAAPAASAAPAPHAKKSGPPVIKLKDGSAPGTVSVSRKTVRPGVVEFRAKSDHEIDVVKVAKKDVADAFQQIGIMFSQSATPEEAAAAAAKFQSLATMQGGGQKGTRWQVRLRRGNYLAVDVDSNAVGGFQVAGKHRGGRLHRYDSWIHAVKPNLFETSKDPHEGWLQFKNKSREIHFVDGSGVKRSTTSRDVRKALQNPDADPGFYTERHFQLGAISPGVDARYRIQIDKGRYLLACYWTSKTDGMPHALMGMWKLVNFVEI